MKRLEWWESVVENVEQAFERGELFCRTNQHTYSIHLDDCGYFWDVRWHIEKKLGRMDLNFIYVNGELHSLNIPHLVKRLEEIGNELAVMKKLAS